MSHTLAALFAPAAAAAAADTQVREHGPVPAGVFGVQIGLVEGSTTTTRPDGSIEIRDAIIVDAATGREIDGARVLARGGVADHLRFDPQMHGAPVEGHAISTDDGYELIDYAGSVMTAMAA